MAYKSHGDGQFKRSDLKLCPDSVVLEPEVLVFHPENVILEEGVYIGHRTILKGYWKNNLQIGANSWVGQMCFFHAAAGIIVGKNVGIGPGVKILTSQHQLHDKSEPIIKQELDFKRVVIEDDCDIGVGAIVLPGVTIGRGSQIGAGAVVNTSIPEYSIAVGIPCRVVKSRY
jgi:acetyltransferase-like isoleucine patch superfamily enzyme